jgi:hypothetical protein
MRHGLVTLSFLSHRCDTNVTGMTVDSLKSSGVIGRKRAELVVYSRFGRRRSHCETRAGVQVTALARGL